MYEPLRRTALIIGITGQDGPYLAEFLLEKGYKVHGSAPLASVNAAHVDHVLDRLSLHYGDMEDSSFLISMLKEVKPDEVYNLDAQTPRTSSFGDAKSKNLGAGVTLRILEAVRSLGLARTIRYFHASTPVLRRSQSACAKATLHSYWLVANYREMYHMYAVNGVLFNHESPREGGTSTTKQLTTNIAHIMAGKTRQLVLGNLDSKHDWAHARDFVKGMWMMLQQETAKDYVLAANERHSLRELVTACFEVCGRPVRWRGEGLNEEGMDQQTGEVIVQISADKYSDRSFTDPMIGDSARARNDLGWKSETSFKELVHEMMECAYKQNDRELPKAWEGFVKQRDAHC